MLNLVVSLLLFRFISLEGAAIGAQDPSDIDSYYHLCIGAEQLKSELWRVLLCPVV